MAGALARTRGLLLDLLLLPVLLLVLPWILFLVVVRRRGVGTFTERLGSWRLHRTDRERIWVHCVSVGELNAVAPLLAELRAARPGSEFILSVTTTTAREIAARSYPDLPCFLFPIDLSFVVRRVLDRVRPSALVLVELEVWPQLVLESVARDVAVFVVNGRISARGFSRMKRLAWVARPVFRRLTEVHARDDECAARFAALGVPADRIHTLGNIKLDKAPLADPAAVRRGYEARFGGGVRWVAGCTHPGEETSVLAAHRAVRERFPEATLLLAPRHVERTDAVIALVRGAGFTVARESQGRVEGAPPDVVVVDRIGVLSDLYAVGEVAFVGGSLIERGGHNILEPVLASTVPLHGPHMANFRELACWLDGEGIAEEVSAGTLAARVIALLENEEERAERVAAGLDRLAEARGAAARSAERIVREIEARSPSGRARRAPRSEVRGSRTGTAEERTEDAAEGDTERSASVELPRASR